MLAIVLSRKDFRECDQIITLYTKDFGKINVLAKGVKKILSKNSASLEPFCFIDAEILNSKENFHLGGVVVLENFSLLKQDYQKILVTQSLFVLCNKLTEEKLPDKRIFVLLYNLLSFLNNTISADYLKIYNFFVLKLVVFLGFLPQLNFCVLCSKKYRAYESWYFYFSGGGILCDRCRLTQKIEFNDAESLYEERKNIIGLLVTTFDHLENFNLSKESNYKIHSIILKFLSYLSHKDVKVESMFFNLDKKIFLW